MMSETTTPLTIFETVALPSHAMTGSAVMAAVRAFLSAVAIAAGLVTAAAALYLVKSALGINLLPWNSPFHDLLYHFVR